MLGLEFLLLAWATKHRLRKLQALMVLLRHSQTQNKVATLSPRLIFLEAWKFEEQSHRFISSATILLGIRWTLQFGALQPYPRPATPDTRHTWLALHRSDKVTTSKQRQVKPIRSLQ